MNESLDKIHRTDTSEAKLHSSLGGLIIAAIITVILFNIQPYGWYISYPFRILGTWFHEMGHGLMGVITGGQFSHLEMNPDGSGVAYTLSSGIIPRALVAAAELSQRYITDRFLPDKAIDLVDEAASKLAMEKDSVPEEIDAVQRRGRRRRSVR